MSDFAIRVDNLGKVYSIGSRPSGGYGSLRESLDRRFSASLKWRGNGPADGRDGAGPVSQEREAQQFWALRHIGFEVGRGEVVGIVGRNGAGKSTLLKLLSQITEPTEGRIHLRGRVASLLEVGTGFHPELSGRENIFLNGAILGMSRNEVRRKFDEIVAFAEVERFLDTPVKRYSSGMYVRLAFAVAAHLEPEILVVDEVLAVGDAQFQKKCLGRMDSVAESGRTVLFVSHNMSTIQRLCSRGLFLEEGRLVEDGDVDSVVVRYNEAGRSAEAHCFNPRQRSGTGWARVTDMRLVNARGEIVTGVPSDADLTVDIDLALADPESGGLSLRGLVMELIFLNDQGQPITSVLNVDDSGVEFPESAAFTARMRLPGPTFVPGRYHLNLILGIPFVQHVDELVDALTFDIHPPVDAWRPFDLSATRGNSCRIANWSIYRREPSPADRSSTALG